MKIDRVNYIFERLGKLLINLPADATSLGADFLRENISVCRGYLNETSMYLQEILEERTLLTMQLEIKETDFAIRSDDLLANDHRVKTQPALADRQAMINTILLNERRDIATLRVELKNSDHIEKVVRLRHKELDNTMSTLRLQRSLLRDQLRTGSFYGDESDTSRNEEIAKMDGATLDDYLEQVGSEDMDAGALDAVEDIEVASEPPPAPEVKTEPAPPPAEEKDELDELLEGAAVELASSSSTSLEDELEELVASGGIDATPKATKASKKKKDEREAQILPVRAPSKNDVDADMQGFLDQQFEDDLDSILSDV